MREVARTLAEVRGNVEARNAELTQWLSRADRSAERLERYLTSGGQGVEGRLHAIREALSEVSERLHSGNQDARQRLRQMDQTVDTMRRNIDAKAAETDTCLTTIHEAVTKGRQKAKDFNAALTRRLAALEKPVSSIAAKQAEIAAELSRREERDGDETEENGPPVTTGTIPS